jgi:hypothetical protein
VNDSLCQSLTFGMSAGKAESWFRGGGQSPSIECTSSQPRRNEGNSFHLSLRRWVAD